MHIIRADAHDMISKKGVAAWDSCLVAACSFFYTTTVYNSNSNTILKIANYM